MKLIPVKVVCHSGYKAEEYPVIFYWDSIRYEVRDISDRWFQSTHNEHGALANYFKVRTKSMQEFLLKHELESDQWFLVRNQEEKFQFFLN